MSVIITSTRAHSRTEWLADMLFGTPETRAILNQRSMPAPRLVEPSPVPPAAPAPGGRIVRLHLRIPATPFAAEPPACTPPRISGGTWATVIGGLILMGVFPELEKWLRSSPVTSDLQPATIPITAAPLVPGETLSEMWERIARETERAIRLAWMEAEAKRLRQEGRAGEAAQLEQEIWALVLATRSVLPGKISDIVNSAGGSAAAVKAPSTTTGAAATAATDSDPQDYARKWWRPEDAQSPPLRGDRRYFIERAANGEFRLTQFQQWNGFSWIPAGRLTDNPAPQELHTLLDYLNKPRPAPAPVAAPVSQGPETDTPPPVDTRPSSPNAVVADIVLVNRRLLSKLPMGEHRIDMDMTGRILVVDGREVALGELEHSCILQVNVGAAMDLQRTIIPEDYPANFRRAVEMLDGISPYYYAVSDGGVAALPDPTAVPNVANAYDTEIGVLHPDANGRIAFCLNCYGDPVEMVNNLEDAFLVHLRLNNGRFEIERVDGRDNGELWSAAPSDKPRNRWAIKYQNGYYAGKVEIFIHLPVKVVEDSITRILGQLNNDGAKSKPARPDAPPPTATLRSPAPLNDAEITANANTIKNFFQGSGPDDNPFNLDKNGRVVRNEARFSMVIRRDNSGDFKLGSIDIHNENESWRFQPFLTGMDRGWLQHDQRTGSVAIIYRLPPDVPIDAIDHTIARLNRSR